MTGDRDKTSDAPAGFSLRRWSQRKLAAAREAQGPAVAPAPLRAPSAPESAARDAPGAAVPAAEAGPPALPSIESLTADSDFAPFMRGDVDRSLQHKALRKLFADPRFNVMDGLDVYIDDYSKPDPIDAGAVAALVHARFLFDAPATRVDEHGAAGDAHPTEPDESGSAACAAQDAQSALPAAHKGEPPIPGQVTTDAPTNPPAEAAAPASRDDAKTPFGENDA